MSAASDDLYAVFTCIRPVHQLSARIVAASLVEEHLSVPVRAVLERLFASGPQTVPQVARWLLVPRQVAQRLADEAAALGLVEWTPNPAHRRSKLARLTDTGRATFDRIHTAELARLQPIADRLPAEDVAACVRVLARLVVELGELAR
jgi:DNA-binding MarR family transcriptional regulator